MPTVLGRVGVFHLAVARQSVAIFCIFVSSPDLNQSVGYRCRF